jgi:MFS family permease
VSIAQAHPAAPDDAVAAPPGGFVTDVPARLDALPWSRWHWRVVIALGITWMLDGLEVTVVGALVGVLTRPDTLALTPVTLGWTGSAYIAGAVIGALWFGRLADRFGRRRLFLVTLAIYLVATLATAFTWNLWSFLVCRFLTGLGIGGEYAAINSAIDELIPARVRGRVSLAINGSFWVGAAAGALVALVLLDPAVLGPQLGWRAAFGLGALLGVAILVVRRHLPESPRWLMMHGRIEEAEAVVAGIEREVRASGRTWTPTDRRIAIVPHGAPTLRDVAHVLLHEHRRRAILGFVLMVSQAFFYNAIFFTYALVLGRFYGVPEERVGLYLLPFAAGNFLGPLLLGPLFDRIGRRAMIAATYGLAGIGLAGIAWAFHLDWLDARSQTLAWTAVFFLASAAASSAYLTVSEVFPLELRAIAISVFYAIGTGAGGFVAPAVFGAIVASGSRDALALGYGFGAILVVGAAIVAWWIGVDAERRSLEDVATPLSAAERAGRPVRPPRPV